MNKMALCRKEKRLIRLKTIASENWYTKEKKSNTIENFVAEVEVLNKSLSSRLHNAPESSSSRNHFRQPLFCCTQLLWVSSVSALSDSQHFQVKVVSWYLQQRVG